MKVVYELKQFKSSRNKDLTRALALYSRNIEPFLRTDTREIIYWLDEYPLRHTDQFIILGLYLNEMVIGYAQLAYFAEERLIFVDYIVVEKEFRKNNTFYEFVEEIKEFITAESIEFDFILAEVGGFDNKEPSAATKNLIRLLKMTGFGVVKTNYHHPRLGKANYESEFQSILMLYTPSEVKHIKKETYLSFLKTIYFKHYQRWYANFFDEKDNAEYSNSLIKLFEKSQENLKKKETIPQHLF
jgi:N-acetylglutamate synthase-like GNAT family acetyltransferase